MDYQEYVDRAKAGSDLVDQGEFEEAIRIFRELIADDLADLDKAIMCVNLAVIYDKMGMEIEVLAAYDRGIGFERPHCRFYVAESKAAYLAQHGKPRDALRIYESLLPQRFLCEQDRLRIATNIGTVSQQIQADG